jgi:ribosomal protein S3
MIRHVLMQGLTFIGLRIKINGRLNIHKSKRSVHLYITKKNTKMTTIKQKVNYALTHAFTKHGVIGIKI